MDGTLTAIQLMGYMENALAFFLGGIVGAVIFKTFFKMRKAAK